MWFIVGAGVFAFVVGFGFWLCAGFLFVLIYIKLNIFPLESQEVKSLVTNVLLLVYKQAEK